MNLRPGSSTRPVFRKLGGGFQLLLESPEDLANIMDLDEARWIACSAPVDGLNCDPAFARLVDMDGNGRIRPDELKTACRWMLDLLADRSDVGTHGSSLRLDAIDTRSDDGQRLRATAERILENLDQEGASEIRLDQVRDRQKFMAAAATNGDGVIPASAVDDPEIATFIADIGACLGFVTDAGGKPGVTDDHLSRFLAEARAWLAWWEQGQLGDAGAATAILCRGADTAVADAALEAVREKLDQFYILCGLSRFDPRLVGPLPYPDAELVELSGQSSGQIRQKLQAAPIALPNAEALLYFDSWVNPLWEQALLVFRQRVLSSGERDVPLPNGRWRDLQREFEPYRRWVAGKKGARVEALGVDKLRMYTGEPRFAAALRALIQVDRQVAHEVRQIADVERMILYQRWLLELANNFVNFTHFYNPQRRSLVELGTLVMDGRRFNLTFRVADRKKHKERAKESSIFLLYLEVTGKDGQERFEAAAAVTSASRGSLHLGKRGIFVTQDDRVWDAVVVDILENPISLWEAIKLPFLRLAGFVARQTEKFTAARYDQLEGRVGQELSETESSLKGVPLESQAPASAPAADPPQSASPPASPSASPSMGAATREALVGGGIAVAAMSSALAYIANTLASIDLLQLIVAVAVLLLLTLIPTIVIAMIRLGRQDLGRVLEAGGWAINQRLPIRGSRGLVFTWKPTLPGSATRRRGDLLDIFKRRVVHEDDDNKRWVVVFVLLCVLLVVALSFGFLSTHGFVLPWLP